MDAKDKFERLTALLAELAPIDKEDILKDIEKEGIKGIRADCTECLMTRYLSKKLGFSVRVGALYARLQDDLSLRALLPDNIQNIVFEFDLNRLNEVFYL